ncbi:UNVERIFIED_CONTAM: hypothetical protein FKN15_020289 [Acipenser sinensis]
MVHPWFTLLWFPTSLQFSSAMDLFQFKLTYWNSNGQQKTIASTSEARPQTQNETVSFSKDNKVMVLGWKHKRLVIMLSTFHDSDCEKVQRTIKRGPIEELDKPSVICDYNIKRGPIEDMDKPSVICDYNIKRGGIDELDKSSVICDYNIKRGPTEELNKPSVICDYNIKRGPTEELDKQHQ